jgi:FkbM family methyltransferase
MKELLYKIFIIYYRRFPLNRGKDFAFRIITKILGKAMFNINGNILRLNPKSFIDKALIRNGEFENDVYELIKETIFGNDIMIDIGANIGYFSILASSIKGVTVFSFEPSSRELINFQENILLNKRNNIVIFPFALGSEDTMLELNLHHIGNPGANSFLNLFETKDKQIVQCFKFDSLFNHNIADRIKLIKIDVEGFEFEVLKGMENFLNHYNNKLIIEISYSFQKSKKGDKNYNPEDIYDFMEMKGFVSKYGRNKSGQYNEVFQKSNMEAKGLSCKS